MRFSLYRKSTSTFPARVLSTYTVLYVVCTMLSIYNICTYSRVIVVYWIIARQVILPVTEANNGCIIFSSSSLFLLSLQALSSGKYFLASWKNPLSCDVHYFFYSTGQPPTNHNLKNHKWGGWAENRSRKIDHCGRCRIRTRDLCHRSLVHCQWATTSKMSHHIYCAIVT